MRRSRLLRKVLAIGAALVALSVALATPAHAQENLVGAYAGTTTQAYVPGASPSIVVDLTVTGVSAQLGQFTALGRHTVDLRTGMYTGSYTFTTANGDQLTATTQGIRLMCLVARGYTLEETIEFTSGTGSFEGVTGRAAGLGAFGTVGNQVALVFKGVLGSGAPLPTTRWR